MNDNLYIDLLKRVLTDFHRMDLGEYKPLYDRTLKIQNNTLKQKVLRTADKFLRKKEYAILKLSEHNPEFRLEGKDWPAYADTMIGIKRLENIEYCFKEVIKDNISGDFIETGVWRGGSVIFMKALMKAYNITDRTVWVADSFEGLPKPNEEKYTADTGSGLYMYDELAVSIETVKNNFKKYDLLDENVKFLKGWFKDTLLTAPIEKLSILRLDGDMYESTMDGLVNLYPKLSKGGFVIVDDWSPVPACKQAVLDYRKKHNINEEIKTIDWASVYWRREN